SQKGGNADIRRHVEQQQFHADARWSHVCGGCGCHPDPVRAALRAITEAAQSRLTAIAGSRDDFSPRIYKRLDRSAAMQ
ncbi:YcaO-like family protein, partial [Rhizobium johnstonii]|uniref:YcaO-like family protein n=1 Tax=Rhizobium johnstonii TaxID=3019933 RepID=UPI003F96D8F9